MTLKSCFTTIAVAALVLGSADFASAAKHQGLKRAARHAHHLARLGLAPDAPDAVELNEPFTYADGALTTVSGGAWSNNSGTALQQNVVSGRLFLDDNETEDTLRLLAAPVTFGSVNAAFTLQMDPLDIVSSAAGNYVTHFIGSTTSTFIGRVFMITDPAGTGTTYRIGVSTIGGTPTAIFAGLFTTGTTYSLSLTYNLGTDTASLAATGFGSITATDTVDDNNITAWGWRQSTTHGDVFVDDLVVTSIPEPTTSVLMGVGLLLVAQRFVRRKSS